MRSLSDTDLDFAAKLGMPVAHTKGRVAGISQAVDAELNKMIEAGILGYPVYHDHTGFRFGCLGPVKRVETKDKASE
jgi:hypothetical protein